MGLSFGLIMGGYTLARGSNLITALVGGLLGGLVFGVLMGPLLRAQFDRQRQAVGVLDERVRRPAGRASLWGPAPEDPEVRAAALRVAEHGLAEQERRSVWTRVLLVLFLALEVWQAIVSSPWFWIPAAFFAALLASSLLLPRRLRRRIALLRADEPQA